MKKCPNCGTPNREDSRFCERCGTPFAQASEPEQTKSDRPLICPNCDTPNNANDVYCRRCGSALPKRSKPQQPSQASPRAVAGRPVQAAPNRAQTSLNPGAMPATSKTRKKTGLYADIGIAALFVAAVLIGVFVFGRNSNASSDHLSDQTAAVNKKLESQQEDRNSAKEETSAFIPSDREDRTGNVTSAEEPSSSPNDSNRDDSYESPSSSADTLPLAHITREKSSYTGPAVAQIILEYRGIVSSQEEIANSVMIDGVSDYEKLAGYLTRAFDVNGISAMYAGVYLELYPLTAAHIEALYNSIDTNLSIGYPTIVCVNFQTGNSNMYSLIYGSERDESGYMTYRLYVPDEAGHTYDLTENDLIQLMTDSGFFCCLY